MKLQVGDEHELEGACFGPIVTDAGVHPVDRDTARLGQPPALVQTGSREIHRGHLPAPGIRTVLCNVRAPRMNAITERWIGGCRRELLD